MNNFKQIMKFCALLTALTLVLTACTDTKKQEKDSLQEVIKIHDEAMAKSEQAIQNKMLLDSLTKTKAVDSTQSVKVVTGLLAADKGMEDWMHQFNADYTGKSHDEIMQYLADQKKKVTEVNNQLNTAVSQSNQFISTHKK